MARFQGTPCWFELGTSDLDGAGAFYGTVLGWSVTDSGMDGFDYRLAQVGGNMVAGMMDLGDQQGNPPPNWMVYLAADDCDATAAAIEAAGGTIKKPPADIPGTGRFAVAADPQGAVFGILQPDMTTMSPEAIAKAEAGDGTAFDQKKESHGNWLELMTTDLGAGFDFYAGLFGWQKSQAMDMGEMGTYQLFSHGGADIGGMMRRADGQPSAWMVYFGANGIDPAIARIKDAGGAIHHGPQEVPGGAFIAIAQDPQGAWFAIVGPKEHTA